MQLSYSSFVCTAFAALTATAGLFFYWCLQPPTPPEWDETRVKDSFSGAINEELGWLVMRLYRAGVTGIAIWQALYIMLSHGAKSSIAGPRSEPRHPFNETLLTPNAVSVSCLAIICLAGYLRTSAFSSLGKDFTFELRRPKKLNTSGLYAYMQHPSYTGGMIAIGGGGFWFLRCDGILGIILPVWVLNQQDVLNYLVPGMHAALVFTGLMLRVKREEEMMHGEFGKEWERWHANTARFLPFLI